MRSTKTLNYDDVCRQIDIDTETGIMTWKEYKNGRKMSKVGFTRKDGYSKICINGRQYYQHTIAWLLYYGEMPAFNIDHINGKDCGNGVWNLRVATQQQNCSNRGSTYNKKIIYKGVYTTLYGRFIAKIQFNGKSNYLGTFNNPIEAAIIYDAKAIELFGEFAKTNKMLGLL